MPRVSPPAPAIVGDVYRFTVVSVTNAQTCYTTHDYMSATIGGASFALLQLLTNAFSTAVLTAYAAVLTPQTTIIGVIGQVVSNSTIAKFFLSDPTPGTVVVGSLPGEVAAIINKVSDLKGAHGHGRFSMPAVPLTFVLPTVDPNRLLAAALILYGDLCTALFQTFPLAATPAVVAVVSTRPVAPATVVSKAQTLNAMQPNTLLGTVRRRKEGRGI